VPNITVEQANDKAGNFVLRGTLNRETIPQFWPDCLAELTQAQQHCDPLNLDLADIEHIDTAGLAWLLNLLRDAKQQQTTFTLSNVPPSLLNLAKISDVEAFLPLQ
jgi:phospholipid transport system transporter-binding protein